VRLTRLAIVAAAFLLAGLAAAQTAPRRAPEGTLTVAYHTFAKEVLDPGLHSTLGVMYHGHLFDYLIGTAPNGELAADRGLATSWTMSDGGQTWTLKLRPNVKWHDGKPFTADDVVFTFMDATRPRTPCAPSAAR
jgi:peptide/nickel transport system substrate-binding protein